MLLQPLDWLVAILCVLICFVPGLFFGRRAGQNTSEFFASGRSVPWWLAGVATVFFYARLWRRSGVMTDLEFYEIRYSGTAASVVRGFRAIYLGLLFNCMIMATVNLAAVKIAGLLFGLERWQTLLFVGLLNVAFAAHSGLWGVLVIDMIQFFIKMSAVIAAAYFAVTAPQVGGLDGLVSKLSATTGPNGINYLNMLPDFT